MILSWTWLALHNLISFAFVSTTYHNYFRKSYQNVTLAFKAARASCFDNSFWSYDMYLQRQTILDWVVPIIFSLILSIILFMGNVLINTMSYYLLCIDLWMLQYLGISYYVNFLRGLGNNEFHIEWRFGTHGSCKNQNPGGHFGATS